MLKARRAFGNTLACFTSRTKICQHHVRKIFDTSTLPNSCLQATKIDKEIHSDIVDMRYASQNPAPFSMKVAGMRDRAPISTHLSFLCQLEISFGVR
jgi:hypothetical protein